MRIALFGDLHGNLHATEAVLAAIDAEAPDAVVCLGDLVGYGAFPNETIALVRDGGIPCILGNYDDGVGFDRDDCGCAYRTQDEQERGQASLMWTREATGPEEKAYLRSLPFDWRLAQGEQRVRAVHGSPRRINEYLHVDRDRASLERIAAMAGSEVLAFGHTHVPWAGRIGGVLMVNAGSVGKPKDGDPRACWALVTMRPGQEPEVGFRRVAYDVAAAAAAIRATDLPERFARDIETGGHLEARPTVAG